MTADYKQKIQPGLNRKTPTEGLTGSMRSRYGRRSPVDFVVERRWGRLIHLEGEVGRGWFCVEEVD